MKTFGDNLKAIREQKEISQATLAQQINVHSTHLSRYERNVTSPTLDVVKKLTEALDVTADELIYGPAKQKAQQKLSDNELLGMFAKVQGLDKESVKCVKTMLDAFILKSELKTKFK